MVLPVFAIRHLLEDELTSIVKGAQEASLFVVGLSRRSQRSRCCLNICACSPRGPRRQCFQSVRAFSRRLLYANLLDIGEVAAILARSKDRVEQEQEAAIDVADLYRRKKGWVKYLRTRLRSTVRSPRIEQSFEAASSIGEK